MIVEKTKTKEGLLNYSILEESWLATCEFCGEPISKTNIEFGMDCENHCAEKEFSKKKKKENRIDEVQATIKIISRKGVTQEEAIKAIYLMEMGANADQKGRLRYQIQIEKGGKK